MSASRYRALVGPSGTEGSDYDSPERAKEAVDIGLQMAADVNPSYAAEIDGVLLRLRAAEDSFIDYFTVDGDIWTAQFWAVG